jgi:hypothetical protein
MHNGLKVLAGSFTGIWGMLMLEANTGVHEPEEEAIFGEILPLMPANAVMLELGAYWGFYSMWFHQRVAGAQCYLIEPDLINLAYGKHNFKINGMNGDFTHGGLSSLPGSLADGTPLITIDLFLKQKSLSHVHLLHADIQEYELEMLKGAAASITEGRILYFFVSTHSEALHTGCRDYLRSLDCDIVHDIDLQATSSIDGLLVARHRAFRGPLKAQ